MMFANFEYVMKKFHLNYSFEMFVFFVCRFNKGNCMETETDVSNYEWNVECCEPIWCYDFINDFFNFKLTEKLLNTRKV